MSHEENIMTTSVMRDGAQAFMPNDTQPNTDEWTHESSAHSFGMDDDVLSASEYDDAFWQNSPDVALHQRQRALDEFEDATRHTVMGHEDDDVLPALTPPPHVTDEAFRVGVLRDLAAQQQRLSSSPSDRTLNSSDSVLSASASVSSGSSLSVESSVSSLSSVTASRFPSNPFAIPIGNNTNIARDVRKAAAVRAVNQIMTNGDGENFRRGMARFFGLVNDYATAIGEMYFPGFDRRTYNLALRDWRLAFFHYYGDGGILTPVEIIAQLRTLYFSPSHQPTSQRHIDFLV